MSSQTVEMSIQATEISSIWNVAPTNQINNTTVEMSSKLVEMFSAIAILQKSKLKSEVIKSS